MNPSVDPSTVGESPADVTPWQPPNLWLTLVGMLALPLLQYGVVQQTQNVWLDILALLIVYPLSLYLYRTVASRAYVGGLGLLLTVALAAALLGALLGIPGQYFASAASIAIVPLVAILVGYRARTESGKLRLYVIGGVAVILGSLVIFAPMWVQLIEVWRMVGGEIVADLGKNMTSFGYHADTVEEYRRQSLQAIDGVARVIPIATLMSPLALFSVGYLWFLQSGLPPSATLGRPEPLERWKIPFALAPVLITAIAGRLLGGEMIQQVADNTLLFLAIVYAVGGLALVQSYLTRIKLPIFVRIMFYIMLTLTGVIGFVVTVLLGFLDSFADWRKIESGSIELEKN